MLIKNKNIKFVIKLKYFWDIIVPISIVNFNFIFNLSIDIYRYHQLTNLFYEKVCRIPIMGKSRILSSKNNYTLSHKLSQI